MCYGSGTVAHTDITSHVLGRLVCSQRRMQQRAAGGRQHHHLESMTSNQKMTLPVDAYLLKEQSCQISPLSDLKRQSLKRFWTASRRPNKNKKNNKMIVAIWDQFLIQTSLHCYADWMQRADAELSPQDKHTVFIIHWCLHCTMPATLITLPRRRSDSNA